jgi:DNA polymerase epsilon subunit 2
LNVPAKTACALPSLSSSLLSSLHQNNNHPHTINSLHYPYQMNYNTLIASAFRRYGYVLRPAASALIYNTLADAFQHQMIDEEADEKNHLFSLCNQALNSLLERIVEQKLNTNIIEESHIQSILNEINGPSSDSSAPKPAASSKVTFISVASAFHSPRYEYDSATKQFKQFAACAGNELLFGSTPAKINYYRGRYNLLLQHTRSNELFDVPLTKSAQHRKRYLPVSTIESIYGATKQGDNHYCILGMLTQIEDGRLFIEDLNSYIEIYIDYSNNSAAEGVKLTSGFYTDNSYVLAEGRIVLKKELQLNNYNQAHNNNNNKFANKLNLSSENEIFYVSNLGFPPVESRENTLKKFPQLLYNKNLILNKENKSEVNLKQLNEMLAEKADDFLIILSEFHLDRPDNFLKLRKILDGFSQSKLHFPAVFIIAGSFWSVALGTNNNDLSRYVAAWNELADLFSSSRYGHIVNNTRFIFIPGPNDTFNNNNTLTIYPQNRISSIYCSKLQARLRYCEFTSNPSRIYYYDKEIVLFRYDAVRKLRKNCLIQPLAEEDNRTIELDEHAVSSILSQFYLLPLANNSQPIYWNNYQPLQLYPLPHLLVLLDNSSQPFDWAVDSCNIINPGDFTASGEFILYKFNATLKAEKSCVKL